MTPPPAETRPFPWVRKHTKTFNRLHTLKRGEILLISGWRRWRPTPGGNALCGTAAQSTATYDTAAV